MRRILKRAHPQMKIQVRLNQNIMIFLLFSNIQCKKTFPPNENKTFKTMKKKRVHLMSFKRKSTIPRRIQNQRI